MGKEKKKKEPDNHYWFQLIHFRWKALIRSNEYKTFVDEKLMPFLKEQWEREGEQDFSSYLRGITEGPHHHLTPVYFSYLTIPKIIEEIDFKKPKLKKVDNQIKEKVLRYLLDRPDLYKRMLFEYLDSLGIEVELDEAPGIELMNEARDRFGVLVHWVEALLPVDIENSDNRDLWLSFTEYMPLMPTDHQYRDCFKSEEVIVEEISDPAFHLEDYREVYPYRRIFAIDTDMPFEMVMNRLRRELVETRVNRAQRKEFVNWEEYFKVWDIRRHVCTKNFLLETGRRMFEMTGSNYYAENGTKTRQAIKDHVGHALAEAEKLINLAGRGKFVKLKKTSLLLQ